MLQVQLNPQKYFFSVFELIQSFGRKYTIVVNR